MDHLTVLSVQKQLFAIFPESASHYNYSDILNNIERVHFLEENRNLSTKGLSEIVYKYNVIIN